VNVAGYKAEELRMKITKKTIIVHTETKTMTRQFSKKISIPAGVRPETIRNTLTPENGILTISAPIVEEPQTPAENVAVQPQLDLANTSTTTESHFEDISKQIQSGAKKFQVMHRRSSFHLQGNCNAEYTFYKVILSFRWKLTFRITSQRRLKLKSWRVS